LLAALAALIFAAAACRHTAAPSIATVEILESGGGGDAVACGALCPGMHAVLRGHVAAVGSDTSDSFAFVAASPCTLRCRVRPSLPGTEIALRAVDSGSGRRIDVSEGEAAEETATVRIERAGAAVDLVVSANWGSTSYALEVAVEPGAGPAEEPARPARVPLARAPLADRGFPVETGLLWASGTSIR
jgi:hypothetical protein